MELHLQSMPCVGITLPSPSFKNTLVLPVIINTITVVEKGLLKMEVIGWYKTVTPCCQCTCTHCRIPEDDKLYIITVYGVLGG